MKNKIPTLSNKAQYYNYFDGVEDKDIIDNCFEQILYLNNGIDDLIEKCINTFDYELDETEKIILNNFMYDLKKLGGKQA